MEKENVARLIDYLNKMGRVRFNPPDFDDERIDYASIELVIDQKLADGLQTEINSCLNEQNGSRAEIVFIALEELTSEGKYRYVAEIIPLKNVPRHLWPEVTEEYLRRLPKIIANYRHKNPSKRRGR